MSLAKSLGNVFTSMVSIASSSFTNNSSEQLFKSSSDDLEDDPLNTEDALLEIHKELTASEKSNIPGVVSVKIKKLSIDTGLVSSSESFSSVYCLLQHRNWQARTTIVRDHQGKSRFDQVKHFPVNFSLAAKIVTNRAHPFNLVRLDVIGIGQHLQENRIGGILFHMHDIITGTPISREFQLAGTHLMVGRIGVELTFNYGSFGYGMDRQLQEEDCSMEELLLYSLFPRLNPDEEEVNQNGYVIKSQAIPHPNFISFEKKVYLSYGLDLKKQLESLSKNMEPKTSFESGMKKTEAIQKHYYKIDDRAARLRWLHSNIQRPHNREEIVAEPGNHYKEEEFPSRKYIRFLKPLTTERDQTSIQMDHRNADHPNTDIPHKTRQILNVVTVQEMDMRRSSETSIGNRIQRKFSSFINTAKDYRDE